MGFLTSLFSPPKPDVPAPPPPEVSAPTRTDPDVVAARKRARESELRRQGRRASVFFGREREAPLGVAQIQRPAGRAAQTLGG